MVGVREHNKSFPCVRVRRRTSITISKKLAFRKADSAAPEFNYTQFGDVIFMYLFKCDGNPLAKRKPMTREGSLTAQWSAGGGELLRRW